MKCGEGRWFTYSVWNSCLDVAKRDIDFGIPKPIFDMKKCMKDCCATGCRGTGRRVCRRKCEIKRRQEDNKYPYKCAFRDWGGFVLNDRLTRLVLFVALAFVVYMLHPALVVNLGVGYAILVSVIAILAVALLLRSVQRKGFRAKEQRRASEKSEMFTSASQSSKFPRSLYRKRKKDGQPLSWGSQHLHLKEVRAFFAG